MKKTTDVPIGNLQVAARSSAAVQTMASTRALEQLPDQFRIGLAAKASGMSAASIRFYEQQGLLSPAVRSDNGYRLYAPQDVVRLRRAHTCRNLGMSLAEIRLVLDAPAAGLASCATAVNALRLHQQHIQNRVAELQQLHDQLAQLLALCEGACIDDCVAQQALGEQLPNARASTVMAAPCAIFSPSRE